MTEARLIARATAVATRLDPRSDGPAVRLAVRELLAGWVLDDRTHQPPVWPAQLGAAVTRRYDFGHAFTLRPRPLAARPGLLVFLHGHGPNSSLYLHLWREFADRHGFVVVCPSFGFGNWEHPAGVAAVRRALDTTPGYDPARVLLGGVSQGGAGVVRAAVAMPGRVAGLVLLSPTTEPVQVARLARVWSGKPVYVAQGGRDRNVRPGPVLAAAAALRAAGARVAVHLDPAADHGLFLTRRAAVQAELGVWLPDRSPKR